MHKEITLVVLLDAFRHNYLDPVDTPFLYSLLDKSIYVKKLVNPGGFCERSVFMTGANPDVTDNYFAMAMRPVGYKRPAHEPMFNVPLAIRSNLVMTEDESVDYTLNSFKNYTTGEVIESIWDVMLKHGKKFAVESCVALGVLSHKGKTTHGSRAIQLAEKMKDGLDLAYIQFSETDQQIHYNGIENRHETLKYVDSQVKWLYEEASKYYSHVKLLVFGDHGMDDVQIRVDLPLEYPPYIPTWDYLYLKSSTAIQFWVYNESVAAQILNDPKLNFYGTFVPSPSKRQADIIWLANYGVLVSPCHFHAANDPIRAMHGWDKNADNMKGMAIIHGVRGIDIREEANLNDICNTICDLVNVPYPKQTQGRSLCINLL